MATPNDPNTPPPEEGEITIFSKALKGAKNILTGKSEPEVVDEVLAAKTELEKALVENKEVLLKENEIKDKESIKEKMQVLAEKAEELEQKLDTFEDEASKNIEVEKAAVIDVESLRELSEEVKEVAKETVDELENKKTN